MSGEYWVEAFVRAISERTTLSPLFYRSSRNIILVDLHFQASNFEPFYEALHFCTPSLNATIRCQCPWFETFIHFYVRYTFLQSSCRYCGFYLEMIQVTLGIKDQDVYWRLLVQMFYTGVWLFENLCCYIQQKGKEDVKEGIHQDSLGL